MGGRAPTMLLVPVASLALAGCAAPRTPADTPGPRAETPAEGCANRVETGMPLFGDLHVHTSFSFDAAANTTGATPDDAQRYARGEPIPFWPLGDSGEPVGTTRIDPEHLAPLAHLRLREDPRGRTARRLHRRQPPRRDPRDGLDVTGLVPAALTATGQADGFGGGPPSDGEGPATRAALGGARDTRGGDTRCGG